ncbi:TPA: hypothetical protein QDB28_004001 [Burkholderia vietnamiensis]|nr:hypothetical protein [Burkholderia vietnamiensis]
MSFSNGAPSSQKADVRPISFTLQDVSRGSQPLLVVPMYVRPEELTVVKPSRTQVHQTFGGDGGWADSFGGGVPSLELAGTTGWRPDESGDDGLARFQKLHQVVFSAYHGARAAKVTLGMDPDDIKLIFCDSMDNIAWVVTPNQFVLKRDKRRPLLAQFHISLTYLSQYVSGSGGLGSTFGALQALGLDSLAASLQTAYDFLNNLAGGVASALGGITSAVKGFVNTVCAVTSAVRSVISAGLNVINTFTYGLISIAKDLTRAASSVFSVFSMITGIPSYVKAQFMKVRSAFTNIFCVFSNCFAQSKTLQDYSGVYGSSNCSSTAGGSPLSAYLNVNTFEAIQAASPSTQLSTTPACANSINTCKQFDPVLNPPSTQMIMGHLVNINTGLTVTTT